MLLGNVGMEPELRQTPNGSAVLKLRLATSESYLDRNKQRQERTDWHSVVMWGKRAEALAKFLSKGSRLFVEGSIRTSSYDDREGNKRYRTEIVATNVILAGGGSRSSEGGGGARRASNDDDAVTRSSGGGYDGPEYDAVSDDDIPF
jgi:single-strand DNA-binding protein